MSETDVLVLGSGLAGMMTALHAAEFADVTVLAKGPASETNTSYAQGGIAAVFDRRDSFAAHERDTLVCGAGMSDPRVVRAIVHEAPAAVAELETLGVAFSRQSRHYELGREGGHSARRIVHASDFTGRAIQTALLQRVRAHPRIRLIEDELAVDLLMASRLGGRRPGRAMPDRCWGAYVMHRSTRRIRPMTARVTVLATGGCGKVYLYTSNPDTATGDGIAMGYRAGAAVTQLEFMQFHPTVLFHPLAKSFLLSEALRGEGARLRTLDGTRFMPAVHPRAELAPRDVVALAIDRELKRRGEPHVWLDISHRPAGWIRRRFPNIAEELARWGFDLTREPIPVVPAAHYMCGGVRATLAGRTSVRGLLALGETACTGLHGANRLASNSLLEALVGARHAAREIRPRLVDPDATPKPQAWSARGTHPPLESVVFDHNWDAVRRVMWDLVGIVRTDQRLAVASRRLALLREEIEHEYVTLRLSPDLIELRNIALVGGLIIECARRRRESRGLHFNLDHPRPLAAWAARKTVLRRREAKRGPRREARPGALDAVSTRHRQPV